jgi:hypothetical protein
MNMDYFSPEHLEQMLRLGGMGLVFWLSYMGCWKSLLKGGAILGTIAVACFGLYMLIANATLVGVLVFIAICLAFNQRTQQS